MRRLFLLVAISVVGVLAGHASSVSAYSSDGKQFINADNTFYAYVKGGETIAADFTYAPFPSAFDSVRGEVTFTLDGPDAKQQKCVTPTNLAAGQGCHFAPVTATKSGIWRIQVTPPADAKVYDQAAPNAHWGANWFAWSISVKSGASEQPGRVWTEQYNVRQPDDAAYIDNLIHYYISEDGYIYKATEYGYNGQISTLSADGIGVRSGTKCTSAYQSVDVSSTDFSPSYGTCGSGYKLFFEQPAGDLPASATTWDGKTDWVRPSISRPSIAELHFVSNGSQDQQSGTVSFFLRNFVGQYQVKIDVDNDGSFDGQNDVVLNQQMKKLSSGLQQVYFDGVDKTGQIIPTTQKIGIKIEITKVAEIHLVAVDVEARTGGIELTRLNGDNAPTTRVCWNDTDLEEFGDASLMTKERDGRSCPDSTGGVHAWINAANSWGNARYIDDWSYASARLDGTNTMIFPQDSVAGTVVSKQNWLLVVGATVAVVLVVIIAAAIVITRRHKRQQQIAASAQLPQPVQPPVQQQSSDQPTTYDGQPPSDQPGI
jgi:hypothetical protein